MNFFVSQFLIGLLIHSIAAELQYKHPDEWRKETPTCGGSKQSPIDLDAIPRVYSKSSLSFMNYYTLPSKMKMENNGHTVQITPSWEGKIPTIFKDGVGYEIQQFHFHWGSTNSRGSEHIFHNINTPLEVHLVHWNPKFGKFDAKRGDGILVFGILFEINDECGSKFLRNILKHASEVKEPESKPIQIQPFLLSSILSENHSDQYLLYTGSLTTPPCSEGVTWVINNRPSVVSEKQMELFRIMKFAHGDNHNYRPLEPINGRYLSVLYHR